MVAIEEEIDQAILSQKRWADLDNRMRDLIGSSQEYDKKIIKYSVENQLRYRGNLVRYVEPDEYEYYRNLLKYSRDHLMLFPYHLSDFIITGMRITPFQYYLSTMTQLLEQEKSYDTLPNFTAADCLLLLGIGRNQYIDIMNELRSTHRRFLGIGIKRNARSLLPNKPDKDVPIEPWWFVNAGYITEDDVRSMVTPAERSIIDRLISPDGLTNQILACDLDEEQVRSLYLKGLIYLDVPIYDDDHIVVPPLEGFVMNRITGDYFETLLYKIFVSIDQNTPVQELSKILKIDIKLVKNAVSMYCRLKFAYKKNIYIDIDKSHSSWTRRLNEYCSLGINVSQQVSKTTSQISDFIKHLASPTSYEEGRDIADTPLSLTDLSLDTKSHVQPSSNLISSQTSPSSISSPSTNQTSHYKKIVLFYDSNLAAFLMMGNLSAKLKNHAVTMFEVGKLSDEWIDSLLDELSKISGCVMEDDGYEARRYYIHAILLHRTIEFIRTDLRPSLSALQGGEKDSGIVSQRVGLDLIRVESLSTLDSESCERFLKKNYQLIISVAPLSQDVRLTAAASLPHLGPKSQLINSLWFRLFIYYKSGHGPASLLLLQGYRLAQLPKILADQENLLINHWSREPTCVSRSNAISAINDALTHSPVLVQAYPIQPIGGNLVDGEEKVFVPLPLHIDEDSSEEERKLVESTPVRALAQSIQLNRTCGYIVLVRSAAATRKLIQENETRNLGGRRRLDTLTPLSSLTEPELEREGPQLEGASSVSSNEQTSRENSDDLTLFECHFGIPLFDRALNKKVLNRISSLNLCEAESLTQLVEATKDLDDSLERFVGEYKTDKEIGCIESLNTDDQRHFFVFPDNEQFRCSVPRPAQNLIFQNGSLSVFEEES